MYLICSEMTRIEKINDHLKQAWNKRIQGNLEESKNHLKLAEAECRPNDYGYLGRIHHIYRQHEMDLGHLKKALTFSETSIGFYIKAQNMDRIAHSTRHLADIYKALNQLDLAENNYIKTLEIYKSLPETSIMDLTNAQRGLADLYEKKHQIDSAITLWQDILENYTSVHYTEGITEAKEQIAFLKTQLK